MAPLAATKPPPVWVISLPGSTARRANISRQLASLGLGFEFFDAVDGAKLSDREIRSVYDPKRAVKKVYRELNRAEIGCCLSHIGIYRKMVEEGVEEAIVLEDDAVLGEHFLEVIESRDRFPADLELLLLYHQGGRFYLWRKQRLDDRHRLVHFVTPAMGTVGYFVRRSAAQKILATVFPIRAPSDHVTGGDVPTGAGLYGVEPPCVGHSPEFEVESTIQGRDQMWENYRTPGYPWKKYWYSLRSFVINIHVRLWPRFIK